MRWSLRRSSVVLLAAVLIGGCAFFIEKGSNENSSPGQPAAETQPPAASTHLAFGNPSNAGDFDDDNFLVFGTGSVFSYSNSRGTVNWVSWKTTRSDLGDSIPRPDFRPDPRLPARFRKIAYFDYSGSGYDRGHMVPSADRFADARLNDETFMMTNIVPQTSALNQYPWNKLESYARSQAWRGWDVYQIAGVYGNAGMLNRKVVIPTNCWKVIMLLPKGLPVERIDKRTRLIAVDMPNVNGIENKNWEEYRTTVRAIETKTGYDLFSNLDRALQDVLETKQERANR